MKLRIRGNSVRVRLGPSEVRRLAQVGCVEQSTSFGPLAGQRLVNRIERSGGGAITATFDGGRLVVRIPHGVAIDWAESDAVSLAADQATGDGVLRLLIEKDFECLDRAVPEPGDEDAYPHPAAACPAPTART